MPLTHKTMNAHIDTYISGFINEINYPVVVCDKNLFVFTANINFCNKYNIDNKNYTDIQLGSIINDTELIGKIKKQLNIGNNTIIKHAPCIYKILKQPFNYYLIIEKINSNTKVTTDTLKQDLEQTQKKLTLHRKHFELLFNNIADAMCLFKIVKDEPEIIDFEFICVNPAFEKAFGYLNNYLKGKRFLQQFSPADPKWAEIMKKSFIEQKQITYNPKADKNQKYWEYRFFPAGDNRIVCTATDITERIETHNNIIEKNKQLLKTEAKLLLYNQQLKYTCDAIKDNELRYKALFENSNDAIIILINNKIVDCNVLASNLFESTTNDITGLTILQLSPKYQPGGIESAELINSIFLKNTQTSTQPVNWRFIKPNGVLVDTRVKTSNYQMSEINFQYIIIQDITTEKNQLQQIEEKQYLLEQAQKIAQLGYWSFDIDNHQLVTWSTEMCKIFETNEPINFSKLLDNYVDTVDKQIVAESIHDFIDNPGTLSFQCRINTPSGKTKYIMLKGEVFFTDNKKICRGITIDITETKQKDEEIIKYENRFQTILHCMPVILCANNPDGSFVFWNNEAERATGYTSNEITNNPEAHKVIAPDNSFINLLKLTQNDNFNNYESIITHKNGTQKTIIWSGYSKKYPVTGWHSWMVGVDITARKEQEEELLEQKKFLELLIDSLPLMIFTKNLPNFEYSLVNKYFEKITNLTKNQIIGKTDTEIQPYFALQSREFDQYTINSSTAVTRIIEYPSINKIFNTTKIAVKPKNQKPYLLGIGIDITEKQQREKQIITESNINQSLANASTQLILPSLSIETIAGTIFKSCLELTNSQNGYVAFNDPMSDNILVHYFTDTNDKKHALAGNIYFFPKHSFFQKGLFGHPIDAENPVIKNNVQLKGDKKIGNILPQLINNYITYPAIVNNQFMGQLVLINSPNGFSNQHLSFIKSLTNVYGLAVFRKRMEWDLVSAKEKAEESDRLKSSFLANMSHEIRTPMNAIIGFSQLLTTTKLSDEKKTEFYTLINNSCDDLLMLVNDIIDISKIEAGQLKLHFNPFNINQLLHEVIEITLCKEQLKNKNLKLIVDTDLSDEITITSDRARLKQVFTNLVGNAIKFTDYGQINIGYDFKDQNTIKFYVKDTGIGIPLEMQQLVFESFRQVDTVLERNYRGTGLGLAISKKIIEQLGGQIGVESAPGKGSKFWFTLPFKSLINSGKNNTLQNISLNLNGKKILIVEDEPTNAKFLETLLQPTNAQIFNAYNGAQAIEKVKSNTPDIILMDIRMPEVDGLEATRQIRFTHPKIPIIAQTAFAMKEDENLCLQAGCNAYLAKPVNQNALFNIIKSFINNKPV